MDKQVLISHSSPTIVKTVKVKVNGVVWNQEAIFDVPSIKKQLVIVG